MDYGRIIQKDRIKFFEVADGVFAAMTPYKGISWANAAFITRGKGLVYDTFFDTHHAREMRECFEELTGGRAPGFLVNSHSNADHDFGNSVFPDAVLIMHKEARREHLKPSEDVSFPRKVITNPETPGEKYLANEWLGFDMTGVEWRDPDIELDTDMRIMLDGTEVQVLNVAPAHSDSDLLVWLPKERVLFAGDVVHIGCGAYSEEGLRNWNRVLDQIIEMNPAVIVPGHGPICGVETVKEQKAYLENALAEFNKNYEEGITTLELCKRADVSQFLHWIQPERIYMSMDSLRKGKLGIPPIPDWDTMAAEQAILRDYQKEKYGDQYQEWDPYITWKE